MAKPDLTQVFAHTAHCLAEQVLASEVLEQYKHDWTCGRMSPKKFRGFLHGLFAARLLSLEDFDELDRAVPDAD